MLLSAARALHYERRNAVLSGHGSVKKSPLAFRRHNFTRPKRASAAKPNRGHQMQNKSTQRCTKVPGIV
eukprot:4472310-Pyramimonas_sp.AAC.1